jgi:hypothetical protein
MKTCEADETQLSDARVPSVDRALNLLDLLASSPCGMNLTTISRRLNIPKSSAYYLLTTLAKRNFVRRSPDGRLYSLAIEVSPFMDVTSQESGLKSLCAPFIRSLSKSLRMTGYQYTLPLNEGVLQETFADLYPASNNPLVPILGKAFGTNVGRGGENLLWYPLNFTKAYNDRLDVNYQRRLPGGIVASVTCFYNLGRQHLHQGIEFNQPGCGRTIEEQYQNALNAYVTNPFYH